MDIESNVQKLHRVFAVFVWGSGRERISGTNLFGSEESCGLGLTHLLLRQVVKIFMFLWDQTNHFLQTVVQVRLREAVPELAVSSSHIECVRVRGIFHEVVKSFQFLKVRYHTETAAPRFS